MIKLVVGKLNENSGLVRENLPLHLNTLDYIIPRAHFERHSRQETNTLREIKSLSKVQ